MPDLTAFMHDYNVRSFPNLEPPVLKTPVVEGNPGSVSYTYSASFETICGETTVCPAITVATGPLALSPSDYIKLDVESVPPGARYIRYYKQTEDGLKLLGSVAVGTTTYLYDIGQAVTSDIPSATNTSGRPQYLALGYHPNEYRQRQEGMDEQGIQTMTDRGLWNTIFKEGDIIHGLSEKLVSGTSYDFLEGSIYLFGRRLAVPATTDPVVLTGTGLEVVGVVPTVRWVPPSEDGVLRAAADEGTPPELAQMGADRLVVEFTWGVDQPEQVKIREFLNGQPRLVIKPTQYSEFDKKIAEGIYDVSGNFVSSKFPCKIKDHPTDATKLIAEIGGGGKAWVNGFPIATKAPQPIEIPKGRDTKTVNNSILDGYSSPGGAVVGTALENFDLDGLAIKLKVGAGNWHTHTFTGDGLTAVAAAAQLSGAINAYPTSGTLITATGPNGYLRVQAPDGKDLEIGAVASDCYSVIGVSTGVYKTQGQRIYSCNNDYIKQQSDLSYITEIVEQVTHDGTDHIDDLVNENVQMILGCSLTLADCHDSKFGFVLNEDFVKDGNKVDFAALGGDNPGSGTTYYCKYRYNYNATRGNRARVRVTDAVIVKGAEDGADTLVFTGGSAVEVKTGNPVTGLSGNARDVIRILRINNMPNQSTTEYSLGVLVKNAGAIEFADSQLSWAASGAQGGGLTGQPVTGGQYYCTFEYWKWAVVGDFLAADSYITDYEEIELAPDGVTNLRDCIDFRPTGLKPIPNESARFDYEFYLGRYDKIALRSDRSEDTSDGWFFRIPGTPQEYPVEPKNQSGPVSLFLIPVPPYTYSAGDVRPVTLEIQRITQQGLNELYSLVQRNQYLAAESMAHQIALNDATALEAKGVFGHALIGQKECDVTFDKNGLYYSAALDPGNRVLRLPVSEDGRTITIDEANSSGFRRAGKVLCFDYVETPFISQLKATDVMPANPHQVFGWIGTMDIDPEGDFWTDVEQIPALDTNYDDQMAALARIDAENAERARQITWGAWRLTSGGGEQANANWGQNENSVWRGAGLWVNSVEEWYARTNYRLTGLTATRTRDGVLSSLVPERILVDAGERVVDHTALPYLRTHYPNGDPFEIAVDAEGLMSNTDVALMVDGVVVNVTPTGTTVAGASTYQSKSTLRTNGSGSATGKFAVPTGIVVGQKTIKLFKAADPDESFAISVFTSQGFRDTRQKLVEGLISVTERDEVITQSQWHYGDPLAQTWAVESGTRWITAVDAFFFQKDASLPVTVEMRTTLNGYPTRTVAQTKTLEASAVSVSNDSSAATKFVFANPVAYNPAEHSFVIVTNSLDYKVFYCRLGGIDILTGEKVNQQPYNGVMFESPNDSTWASMIDCDLKFVIYEANFVQEARVEFETVTGIEANMLITSVTQFLPTGCNLHWFYQLNGSSDWISYAPGIDTELSQIGTSCKVAFDATGAGGTFQISESDAGIIFLLNNPDADHISHNMQLTDAADTFTLYLNLNTDGVNGAGVRSVTPYLSVDDGEKWMELRTPPNYSPIAFGDGTFKEYKFYEGEELTVTDASNATPIVISLSGQRAPTENTLVTITGIGGNTNGNGAFRVANPKADTFELVDPVTGADIAGNAAYTTGGTVTMTPFNQMRYWLRFGTSNRAVTPMCQWPIRGIAA